MTHSNHIKRRLSVTTYPSPDRSEKTGKAMNRTGNPALLFARVSAAAVAAGVLVGSAPAAAAATSDRVVTREPVAAVSALPYGPNTCKQGFVWRVARPSDLVCVTPETRDITAEENASAAERKAPNGGAHGPNTCKQGYVWREAYDGDLVCVTPDRRTLAKRDNELAASRRATEPANRPNPNPAPKCQIVDGVAAGTPVGDNPKRYRHPDSPSLGVRWDSCAHTVTVHYGDATASHYNLRINSGQKEVGGSLRQATFPDSGAFVGDPIAGTINNFTIQACSRSSVGPFSSGSKCTPWSPDVRLDMRTGG